MDIRRIRFSIRSLLLITFLVAVLIIVAIEYGGMLLADGGGFQSVLIRLSDAHDVSEFKYALIQHERNTNLVFDAFASNDPLEVYNYVPPELIKTIGNVTSETELIIRQQWSFTEMGFTKRRAHYTQTFDKLVLHIKFRNGDSIRHVVELPEYHRPTTVDLLKPP